MARLEIDFVDSTDKHWEHFRFRQEGMRGLTLLGCWLPEFVESLENPSFEEFCVFNQYMVKHNKYSTVIREYASQTTLLQLSSEQRAKLIAHLRSTYASLISVYR